MQICLEVLANEAQQLHLIRNPTNLAKSEMVRSALRTDQIVKL
jgi:hypothetical protein